MSWKEMTKQKWTKEPIGIRNVSLYRECLNGHLIKPSKSPFVAPSDRTCPICNSEYKMVN